MRSVRPALYVWDVVFICWFLLESCYFPVYTHALGFMSKIALAGLYVVLRLSTPTYTLVNILGWSASAALSILSGHGYLQYGGAVSSNNLYFTITGPYSNPAIMAGLMALLLSFLCGMLLFKVVKGRCRHVFLFAIVFALPVFILLDARAAWLAYLVGTGYLVYRRYLTPYKCRGMHLMLMLVGMFCVIGAGAWGLYQKRTASADGRLLVWKIAWGMVQEKPLFGHGAQGFASQYMHHQARYFEQERPMDERLLAGNNVLAYNEPLRIAVEYGLIGLSGYLATVSFLLWGFRPQVPMGYVLKGVLLAFLAYGLFSYPQQQYAMLAWMTVIWSAACGLPGQKALTTAMPIIAVPVQRLALGLLLLAGLSAILHLHRRYAMLHVLLKGRVKDTAEVKDFLGRNMAYLAGDQLYLSWYGRELYQTGQYADCIALLKRWVPKMPHSDHYILWGDCLRETGDLEGAESRYRYATRMVPSRQAARGRLAMLYKVQGRDAEGMALARQVLEEPVKVYGFDTYELHRSLRESFDIN
ncbi:O-antigen ligase family protein [Parapedobacter tibetensis]|uniref:O-antigen ligase family protein n=1 Tax=Parapedobacter tibetensis TaxID=2972951 RepID=UPI00214D69EC|nr:O-antigen ligase family protein [Parapedobacter tibetensis]